MRETLGFYGTQVQEVVDRLDAVYTELDRAQSAWKKANPFPCPDGCGTCCVDFEPDVLECEALYLAAWMIAHQPERADAILSGSFVSPRSDPERGCYLFNPDSPYHCTVYEGRCLICRLFGYTGDRGKDGQARWKPCKFLPGGSADAGADPSCADVIAVRRQYAACELESRFGAVPPVMGDVTAQVVALDPDGARSRRPLHEALPAAIAKIRMIQRFSCHMPDPDAPEPNPESPMPRAS